jgi:prefoldin subunit 2
MAVTPTQTQQQPQQLTTEKEIIDAYNKLRREQQIMMSKITELEGEIHEHNLVYEQLKALNEDRRAHRLVGGALIEKTVGQVRPEIQENLNKFNAMVKGLQDNLINKEKEMEEFMVKYKITRQQPGNNENNNNDSQQQQQRKQDDGGESKTAGVLA